MWTAKDVVTLGLSSSAFLLSLLTAWFTLWRRGRLYMVQPSQIYFNTAHDARVGHPPAPQVYLRTTLFSSGKRGQIVESLYARVRRGETVQTFNIWVFGDKELARGSALYVGEQGVASNHHFLLPAGGEGFTWLAGEYALEVYANVVPGRNAVKLHESRLTLSVDESRALAVAGTGVFFDWSPELRQYHRHIANAKLPLQAVV